LHGCTPVPAQAELVTSVCTGAALLARARLLDGLRATTNMRSFAWVQSQGPKANWIRQARWVEDGKFVTSSGVSAGIDMTLAIIARLVNAEIAEKTAVVMATFQQIAAASFGIATPSGTWRVVHRVLARIPKGEADQARQAQLAALQAIRMLLWNQAGADPIRAAQALIKLKAQEARLLGLDMP
jgi:transcriptional regulator GlxA family with amidase domain